jgi:hypothetical protein
MPEKKFYLESSLPLQEIGLRTQVVSFLIAQGIKEGNAVNDPGNTKKVIIAIRDDNENKIRQVRDDLVKHLNKLSKNDFCYGNFPNDLRASELMDLNNPHPVAILRLSDLASSLMLEQTSKGVGAMLFLADSIRPLHELPAVIRQLAEQLAKK